MFFEINKTYLGEIKRIKSKAKNIFVVGIEERLFSAYSDYPFKEGEQVFLDCVAIKDRQPILKLRPAKGQIEDPKLISNAKNLLKTCNLLVNETNLKKMITYLEEGKEVQFDKIVTYFRE